MDAEHESRDIPLCECGAEEGAFHEVGCRWELCPFCGETNAGGCECIYDHLGFRRRENPPECEYLPQSIYENGVDEAGWAEWHKRCAARGRLPYVYAPQTCARCGYLWPNMFIVQDAAWEYYAGPLLRGGMLCESCFTRLRANIDAHQPRPAWVPASDEIQAYNAAWKERDQEKLRRLDPGKFEPRSARKFRYP
jgi:hypothetical protein